MQYEEFEKVIQGALVAYYPGGGDDIWTLIDIHINRQMSRQIDTRHVKLKSNIYPKGSIPILLDSGGYTSRKNSYDHFKEVVQNKNNSVRNIALKHIEPITDGPTEAIFEKRGWFNDLENIARLQHYSLPLDGENYIDYLKSTLNISDELNLEGDRLDIEIQHLNTNEQEILSVFYFTAIDGIFLMELNRLKSILQVAIYFNYPGWGCPAPDPRTVNYFNHLIYPLGIPFVFTNENRFWPGYTYRPGNTSFEKNNLESCLQVPVSRDREIFEKEVKRIEDIENLNFLFFRITYEGFSSKITFDWEDKISATNFERDETTYFSDCVDFFELFNTKNLFTFNKGLPKIFRNYFDVDTALVCNSKPYEHRESNGFHFVHLPDNDSYTKQLNYISKIAGKYNLKKVIVTDFMQVWESDFRNAERLIKTMEKLGFNWELDLIIALRKEQSILFNSGRKKFKDLLN